MCIRIGSTALRGRFWDARACFEVDSGMPGLADSSLQYHVEPKGMGAKLHGLLPRGLRFDDVLPGVGANFRTPLLHSAMQTVLRAQAGGERGHEGTANLELAPPASHLFLILIDDGKEEP